MASVVQSTPPSLPYNLTAVPTTVKDDLEHLSPRQIPNPLSPLPPSPTISRIRSDVGLNGSKHRYQTHRPLSPIARLPRSVSRQQLATRPPPTRPPRPEIFLPNLRPTLILSPDLLTALPSADRPSVFQPLNTTFFERQQAPSPSSLYSQLSNEAFSTPLPSPAFFAPRTWSDLRNEHPISGKIAGTGAKRSESSKGNSKASSPRSNSKHSSPTSRCKHSSPAAPRYYSSKWQYENITRDSCSITALPPLSPPPQGPLPDPPISTGSRSPVKGYKYGEKEGKTRDHDAKSSNAKHRKQINVNRKTQDKANFPSQRLNKSNILIIRHPSNAEKIPVSTTPLPNTTLHHNKKDTPLSHRAGHTVSLSSHHQHQQKHHEVNYHAGAGADAEVQIDAPYAELEGDNPNPDPITIELAYPTPPLTFWKKHRRKFFMLATVLFVLGVSAGILGGIMWRLERIGMVDEFGDGEEKEA